MSCVIGFRSYFYVSIFDHLKTIICLMNFIHQGFWLHVCMCVHVCVYAEVLCVLVTFLVIVVKLLMSLWGVSCT